MKILLLNDNPVVNKLVTLSAQKTSDKLEVINSPEEISSGDYDLLIVDDILYSNELFTELKSKITFSSSLYICSRDAQPAEEFTSTIKKPFLPTDLVELFSNVAKNIKSDETNLETEAMVIEDSPELNILDEIEDDLSSDDDVFSLDDDDILLEEDDVEISLDDELFIEPDLTLEEDELSDSILDNEEAQKVKDLLEEADKDLTEDDDLGLDIDLDLEEEIVLNNEDLSEDEELSLGDDDLEAELNLSEEETSDDTTETNLEDDFSLDEELSLDSELDADFTLDNPITDDLNIEDQITAAVDELNDDDLDSEINEETLLDIVATEINSFDSLTSKDLKIAIGEEVEEEATEEIEEIFEEEPQTDSSQNGVEALKNLLAALTDKNVAASMKGMKISINITLGDN